MHWSTPAPFHCLLHPRCCHSCPCDPLCWRKNGLNSATLRRSSPPQAPSTDSSTPTTRSKETASVLQMQAETVKVVSVNYGACKSTYFHIFHLAIPYFNLKLYCFSTVSAGKPEQGTAVQKIAVFMYSSFREEPLQKGICCRGRPKPQTAGVSASTAVQCCCFTSWSHEVTHFSDSTWFNLKS